MKNVAVLIGAGASYAEAKYQYAGTRTHLPPLDANFFRIAKEIAGPDSLKKVHDIWAHGPLEEARMEEVFSELWHYAFRTDDRDADSAIRQLYNALRVTLQATTGSEPFEQLGPIGQLLLFLRSETLSGHLSILTFNYDLIIERVLDYICRTWDIWNLTQCYGLKFEGFASLGADKYHSFTYVHGKESLPLLKLHGSYNWVFRTRKALKDLRKVAESAELDRITCLTSLQIPPEHVIMQYVKAPGSEDGKSAKESRWPTFPMIVPPVAEKGTLFTKFFNPLWARAGAILEEVDTLVVFGFSMPETDVSIRLTIHRHLGRRPDPLTVVVIDPSPESAARIWHASKPSSVLHFGSVREYLYFMANGANNRNAKRFLDLKYYSDKGQSRLPF